MATLASLPDEIIQHILEYLPPLSVPSVQRASRRFKGVANEPLLWRHFYRTHFVYRDRNCEVLTRAWKQKYVYRYQLEQEVEWLLDSIIASQLGRVEKFQRIVEFGIDAKDTLLRNINAGDDEEDVLARRYYSDAALCCLHRSLAIPEWFRLGNNEPVPLERALGAYDMFILHDGPNDLDHISTQLSSIAQAILELHPTWTIMSTRRKALAIGAFMRSHNFHGIRSDSAYRNLENCFIGLALEDENHQSLPLISVAIYSCIATRLGIDAKPCPFPFHVYAVVHPPQGFTLDSPAISSPPFSSPQLLDDQEVMYMDPFRTSSEIPLSSLKAQLRSLQFHAPNTPYLGAASVSEMVIRSARNIMTSVQEANQRQTAANHAAGHHLAPIPTFPETDGAFYAALWANVLIGVPPPGQEDAPRGTMLTPTRRRFLPFLNDHITSHLPTDACLLEKFALPLFRNLPESAHIRETVRLIRSGDNIPKQIRRRRPLGQGAADGWAWYVKWKVGEVFQHRRYGYMAVITGWDVECDANELWIQQMGIDQLEGGRCQSFYHALVEDNTVRYVAEENIEIIRPEIPTPTLLRLAGKHFKRWDKERRVFVSNIRDEYPDD
ncbi:MAG: hypothetical protein M1834_008825 [Cirrosporium novae-zelandiae]|nr:MAG: hypothetical protein M1834_008825 [Cirrosporium novae-zelandiae]